MRVFILILGFLGIVSQISAVNWDGLRVKYGFGMNRADKVKGIFEKLPRTAIEALGHGWEFKSDDCLSPGTFVGMRYKRRTDDVMNLVMDKNGIIAGVQTLWRHSDFLNPLNPYRFDLLDVFENETINGVDYFVLTAYFVPPETICTTGRTEVDLLKGTGSGVWFQNGSPQELIPAPRLRSEAANLGWTSAVCFPGMGWHNFWQVERMAETNCDRFRPIQLTYNDKNGEMTGFVLYIPNKLSSRRFESAGVDGIYLTIGRELAPPCIADMVRKYGMSSIHFYMIDEPWLLTCDK